MIHIFCCSPAKECMHIVQQYLWEFYICGNISSAGSILSLGILYLWEVFIRTQPEVSLIQLQLPLFPEFSNVALLPD